MTHRLENTSGWSLEDLMPYSPQITAALRKLQDKFPEDGTMESLAQDIMSGSIHLWIALDDDDFKGVALTTIKTNEATGFRAVLIVGAAGEDGVEISKHIGVFEEWGREQGVDACQPIGRLGWKKPLAQLGYTIDRVIYTKSLN